MSSVPYSLPRSCSWPPSTLSQAVSKMEHQLCPTSVVEGLGTMGAKERLVVRGGKVLPLIQPDDLSNGTEGSEATVMSARRRRIAGGVGEEGL